MQGSITASYVRAEPLIDFKVLFPRLEATLVHLLSTQQQQQDDIRSVQGSTRDCTRILVKIEQDFDMRLQNMEARLTRMSDIAKENFTRVDGVISNLEDTKHKVAELLELQQAQDQKLAACDSSMNKLQGNLMKLQESYSFLVRKQLDQFNEMKQPGESFAKMEATLVSLVTEREELSNGMQALNLSFHGVKEELGLVTKITNNNRTEIEKCHDTTSLLQLSLTELQRDCSHAIEKVSLNHADTDRQFMTQLRELRGVIGELQDTSRRLPDDLQRKSGPVVGRMTPLNVGTSITPSSDHEHHIGYDEHDLRQKLSDLLSVVVMVERKSRTSEEITQDLIHRMTLVEETTKRHRNDSPLLRTKAVFTCLSCNAEAELNTQQMRAESSVPIKGDMIPSGILHQTVSGVRKVPTRPGPYTTPNGRPPGIPKPLNL